MRLPGPVAQGPPFAGPNSGRRPVRLVERVARIVRAIGDRGPMTIAETARATGLPYATVHRIVQAFVEHGILQRCADRRLSLAPRAMEMHRRDG